MEAAAPRPPESQGSDPLEEGMALWPTVREQQGEGLHAVLWGTASCTTSTGTMATRRRREEDEDERQTDESVGVTLPSGSCHPAAAATKPGHQAVP